MSKEEWDRGRDIKNDIVRRFFAIAFPDYFVSDINSVFGLSSSLSDTVASRIFLFVFALMTVLAKVNFGRNFPRG
jgi:hypothetical protein